MASPNTEALRLAQAQLDRPPAYLVRRAIVPTDKKGGWRLRITAAPGTVVDRITGEYRNPARHMSEADRRALGLRRNGEPRRRNRAA